MDERNDSQVTDFYRRELAQALSEQAFGISRSEVTHFTGNDAEATVTLLEGKTINIVLSIAGYKLLTEETVYETLDDLLSSTSPAYAAKKVETLMAKLQELSDMGESSSIV